MGSMWYGVPQPRSMEQSTLKIGGQGGGWDETTLSLERSPGENTQLHVLLNEFKQRGCLSTSQLKYVLFIFHKEHS